MDARYRKDQNTLVVTGIGIIVFGLWSDLKNLLSVIMRWDELVVHVYEVDPDISASLIKLIVAVSLLIIYGIGLLIRLYVGLSAYREGRGRRPFIGYRLLAFYILITAAATIAVFIGSFAEGTTDSDTTFASILIDLTTVIMILQMSGAARRIRKCDKAAEAGI